MTENKLSLNEKLMLVQSELKAPKGQYNKFGKYNYRSAEDILEAVKPICAKYRALVILTDITKVIGTEKTTTRTVDKDGMVTEIISESLRTYVSAMATFIDVDTGDSLNSTAEAREPQTKTGMDASQITGTASSYARKYALNGLFCIDDNKDADTDEYHEQTKEPETKSSVEDIIKGINEKMTLTNCKAFYAKAIDQYGKGTPEYANWIKAWADKKDALEKEQTKAELDADFAELQKKIGF